MVEALASSMLELPLDSFARATSDAAEHKLLSDACWPDAPMHSDCASTVAYYVEGGKELSVRFEWGLCGKKKRPSFDR